MPTARMGPPPGALPPMRMTASWSGSERTYRIQVCGAKMRPNGELPSDQYAASRTSDTGASKKGPSVNAGEKMYQRAGVKLHHRGVPNSLPEASRSVLPLPQSILRPAPAPLLNPKSMVTDVGPVELWATRWRRPSAAANPQGLCWPATPRLTHFVTRIMLIRLIHWPRRGKSGGTNQMRQ